MYILLYYMLYIIIIILFGVFKYDKQYVPNVEILWHFFFFLVSTINFYTSLFFQLNQ